MKTDDKIRYFYDNMKINSSHSDEKSQFPFLPEILVAVSIVIGVAIFIATMLTKNAARKKNTNRKY